MNTLSDKVAVVTGALGGIGRATAVALADAGAHLALVDRSVDGAEDLVDRLHQMGRKVSLHALDVRDRDALNALPDAVVAEHGAVHVLVNNAGVTATHPFLEQSEEDFDWVLDVNLHAVVRGTRAFLPHFVAQGEGHVVNISSVFGIVGVPSQVAYSTSKFAVRGFTEALAEELRGTGVGTTVVHPGGIRTGIVANSRADDVEEKARLEKFFEKKTRPPEDVGDAIVAAVLSNKERVLVTPEAYVLDALKRLLPTWGNRLGVRAMVQAMGMGAAESRYRKRLKAKG